jgi:DNA replication protein DnaC
MVAHYADAFPNPRMMRVRDQNVELLFLGGIAGSVGVGRSWLACALGDKACR